MVHVDVISVGKLECECVQKNVKANSSQLLFFIVLNHNATKYMSTG